MPPAPIGGSVKEGVPPPANPISKTSDAVTSLLQLESGAAFASASGADNSSKNKAEVRSEVYGSQVLAQVGAMPGTVLTPMVASEVEAHISPAALLSWANVHTSSFLCADGRYGKEGLFTWGGDFGEFATALNIYEQMATIHLSLADVTSILRKYLESTRREKFTTCITGQAVKQLFGSVDDMKAAVKNPAQERKAMLWMKIADSNFVGNEHVRFMLENPADYSIRKELVQHLVHSFYDILWDVYDPLREKLDLQVLPGEHDEQAVVSVSAPTFCVKDAGLAPLIVPRVPGTSIVVINTDAVQTLRKELAFFFSRETAPVVRADEMNKRFNVLATGQGILTKKRMFDRIPTFSASVSE
jgi:hypothetical protein